MIIDKLQNLKDYAALHPQFRKVVEFLSNNDLQQLEAGKHEIGVEGGFVNVQEAKGKTSHEAVLEIHRKMIDIQVPLSGEETFGYTPTQDLPDADFDEEKDIAFFPDEESQSYVTCKQGMFVIFFPQDGHAPCISAESHIKKAIFKIPV